MSLNKAPHHARGADAGMRETRQLRELLDGNLSRT